MRIAIRSIGNSRGLIIPSSMLTELGLENEVDISVENGTLIIRPLPKVRAGWDEAAKALALTGDDQLVMPDVFNDFDKDWQW